MYRTYLECTVYSRIFAALRTFLSLPENIGIIPECGRCWSIDYAKLAPNHYAVRLGLIIFL